MPLVHDGMAVENFFYDPPLAIDKADLGINALGMHYFEDRDGVTHLLDWVGQQFYPYAADILEEIRRKGLSRRISPSARFQLLEPFRSKIHLVHARGFAWRPQKIPEPQYSASMKMCSHYILTGEEDHLDKACNRYHWVDAKPDIDGQYRQFTDFAYYTGAYHYKNLETSPGLIAAFPIIQLELIAARNGSHQKLADKLVDCPLPLIVMEE